MPAGATYEPITTTTIGTATNVVTFSSISGSYTDLRVVFIQTGATAAATPFLRFNGDTATNYSDTRLYGDGTTAATQSNGTRSNIQTGSRYGSSTTIPAGVIVDVFSYAGVTNKTVLWQEFGDLNGSGGVLRGVGLWRSTAAITSVTIQATANFATGSMFTLYGIKAA